MGDLVLRWVRAVLPRTLRRRISRLAIWPRPGRVRFGSLRRRNPISRRWGADRGTPIDRYYIKEFLSGYSQDVRGHVMEVGQNIYAGTLGGSRITRLDILHVDEKSGDVTVVGDLTDPELFPPETFDCIILTQTLQFMFDPETAVRNCHSFLKPGGVLLVTASGIGQISRGDMDRWGHFWNFTTRSMEEIFKRAFPAGDVAVSEAGNVLSAISLLHGLSAEELTAGDLDHEDPDYQVLITVRASKPPADT
jgi:SAM-dependent methyltransferase